MNLRRSCSCLPSLGLLALAALVLSGCSPSPQPTPTPTPTSVFASEEEAFAAAEETYRAYVDAFNATDLRDPTTFEALDSFTTGDYQADEHEQLSELHAEGFVRTGAIVVETVVGSEFVGDQVRARVCEDVSSVDLRDEEGNSLVAPDRAERFASEVTFEVMNSELRIASVQPSEDERC